MRRSNSSLRRFLTKSREPGPEGPQNVYAISSLALEEIGENKLKSFIDRVRHSQCAGWVWRAAFSGVTHESFGISGATAGVEYGSAA